MARSYFVRSLDYFGKFLLCWFVLETFLYYMTRRFFIDIDDVKYFFTINAYPEAFHVMLIIAVSGLMIVLMGPFLMDGKWVGLALVFLYLAFGNTINPLSYILPEHWQAPDENPNAFFSGINLAWTGIVVLGIAGFFYFRRWKPMVDPVPDEPQRRGLYAHEDREHSLGDD